MISVKLSRVYSHISLQFASWVTLVLVLHSEIMFQKHFPNESSVQNLNFYHKICHLKTCYTFGLVCSCAFYLFSFYFSQIFTGIIKLFLKEISLRTLRPYIISYSKNLFRAIIYQNNRCRQVVKKEIQ